jgi:hypothetical protein
MRHLASVEVGIGVQENHLGGALVQPAQEQIDSDPRSANDRLSLHHVRVDRDPIRGSGPSHARTSF